MKKLLKILLVSGILFIIIIAIMFFHDLGSNEENLELYSHNPKNFNFKKPIEYLDYHQLDSLKRLKIETAKIEVIGSGYSGYDFYMWHRPIEKGEIYIKAFELTENSPISLEKLSSRTNNKIETTGKNFKLYHGFTVIDEGTFEEYYPVRFELWFKQDKTNQEKKLTEKKYLIDGWDR
ncbi:hypothetical protein ML462_15370 [Gramella lutea]|uniref:Uncharacterized protein n=1 Tax=Christiangramia lutea TaxID=1607951 RepID=A0A9X1V4P7_9FLAO|nr:hypothetical protein [Christiangramia lutea]MCH4824552.1 hypothetical protein [Christiangramia lutea]